MEPSLNEECRNLNAVVYFGARFLHPAIPETDDVFTDPFLWERLIESNIHVFALRRTSRFWLTRTSVWYEFFVDVDRQMQAINVAFDLSDGSGDGGEGL